MKFEINSSLLKEVLNKVGSLTGECELQFKPTGMEIEVVDDACVCMGNVVVPNTEFSNYGITGESEKGGIDIPLVLNILKRFTGKCSFEFLKSSLVISDGNKRFAIRQKTVDNNIQDVSKLEFDTEFKIKADTFSEILKDAFALIYSPAEESGSLLIETDEKNKKVVFKQIVEQNEFKKEIVETAEKNSWCPLEDVKGKGKGNYPLEYLRKIKPNNANYMSEMMELKFKKEYPMQLKYEKDKVKYKFIVAPRVTDEEESKDEGERDE